MRLLVRDENGHVMVLNSVNGFVPPGYTLVPSEDQEAEEIALARKNKLGEIRAKRDELLLANDKAWLIASKKGLSTTALEAEAETLRDLPETVELALAELETLEEIAAYEAFE